MKQEKRSGPWVALVLVGLGFTSVCCGCGGFITAAIVEAERESQWEAEEWTVPVDTGVVEVPDTSPPPPPPPPPRKGGTGKRGRR